MEKIPKPIRVGEFINIYKPSADIYKGEKTASFSPNTMYSEWITNDFSILNDGNTWHMVGNTHPRPKGFIDDFHYSVADIHEAEYQLFHCTAEATDFAQLMHEGSFKDEEKILYPASREGEPPEIWAPHLMKIADDFGIVYSPGSMRLAKTRDFKTFEKSVTLFKCEFPAARDPYIYKDGDKYLFVWCDKDGIMLSESYDLVSWSAPELISKEIFPGASCESPFLMKRGEYYYLLWCIFDGKNGAYDNRTYVFASKTLKNIGNAAPIAMFDAHAPEIVCSNGKYYLLSVYYPNNGISAAEIEFI